MRMFFKRFIQFFFLLILFFGLLFAALFHQYQHFLRTPLNLATPSLTLHVAPGDTLKKLANDLARQGILQRAEYLYWYGLWRGEAHLIQAGEYAVKKNTTPAQLFDLLISGKVTTYRITFIEGWSFKQVMAKIRANPILQQQLVGLDAQQIMQRLGYANQHPEGRFFPDTYRFSRTTTDIQLLQRAYQRMQKNLQQAWNERAENIAVKSPEEALILASIVEKETGKPSERQQIAGVFTRRLKRHMRLQTDPTVIYGMGERYQGNIRRKDLRENTPYNTYVHKGLPPTPICMPGYDALFAAVNPADGKALYFVSKGDGSHQFSATLKAHNAAVRKYQLKR